MTGAAPIFDLLPAVTGDEIVPARKLAACVASIYSATGDRFETRAVDELVFGFAGIEGDFHAGTTRRAGGREPKGEAPASPWEVI